MRLLNTDTIELHEYFEAQIPPYAILSHRWEDGEVTLQKLQSGEGLQMRGYEKIANCCRQGAKDGWQYVWIDTCCIDKTSSAELSEAINSMYRWYQNSQVCYAYLCDVPSVMDQHSWKTSAFRRSKWFTRGWTLQELLAPASVEFYDQNWFEIGTKSSMRNLIQETTAIRSLEFTNDTCVAEKMSWAAKRETSRIEDQAYCLMGLFNINMSLLYGEGEKAFMRLQREIWTATNDDSIFAWNFPRDSNSSPGLGYPELSLFARYPTWFESSGGIQKSGRIWGDFNRLLDAMNVTNRGVDLDFRRAGPRGFPRVDLQIIPGSPRKAEFLMPLNCGPRTRKRTGNATEFFAVFLIPRVDSTWYRSDQLGIVNIEEIQTAASTNESEPSRMYIPHLPYSNNVGSAGRELSGVFFNTASLRGTGLEVNEMVWESSDLSLQIQRLEFTDPEGILLRVERARLVNASFGFVVALEISNHSTTNFVLFYEYTLTDIDRQQSTSAPEITSLSVVPGNTGETLEDIIKRWLTLGIPIWARDKSDRISWPIDNGWSMSAAVKKSVDLGRPNYTVYITLDERGEFPWPIPFHGDYQAAIIERNKKVEFF